MTNFIKKLFCGFLALSLSGCSLTFPKDRCSTNVPAQYAMEQTGAAKVLSQSDKNLYANKFITIGSSKREVFEIQGTPQSISDLGWYYGNGSWINFKGGKVSGWDNQGNLRVSLAEAKFDDAKQCSYNPIVKRGTTDNDNGSYYGQVSTKTGRPKTTYVRGYYRKNGTYVRGHYRS